MFKHNLLFSIYDSEDTFDDQINYVNCSFYKTRIIKNGKSVNITCGDDLYRILKPLISHVVSKGKNANYIGFDYVNTYEKVFLKVWNENYQGWRESIIDKPVYLGMCILDLSKTLMYDFHYNYIKRKYEDKAKLLFTDTDSLMYEIEMKDFYEDISTNVKRRFDTSSYPHNHPSDIPSGFNKKVLGMFKDKAAR